MNKLVTSSVQEGMGTARANFDKFLEFSFKASYKKHEEESGVSYLKNVDAVVENVWKSETENQSHNFSSYYSDSSVP